LNAFPTIFGPCRENISPFSSNEEDLQKWRVAANVVNKQLRTADKERGSSRKSEGHKDIKKNIKKDIKKTYCKYTSVM
jgi:hypothetical protein